VGRNREGHSEPNIDKFGISLTITGVKGHSGVYGDSSVSEGEMTGAELECFYKAIQTYIPDIIGKTIELMDKRARKAAREAKKDAEEVLKAAEAVLDNEQ